MHPRLLLAGWAFSLALTASAAAPELVGVGAAMEALVAKHEVAGAVTMVVDKDKVLHLGTTGLADIGTGRKMAPDTLFWIASMTKPVTATAILMLQDEGKLRVSDPVAKYLPKFADLKTPSGKPADLTIAQSRLVLSDLAASRSRGSSPPLESDILGGRWWAQNLTLLVCI